MLDDVIRIENARSHNLKGVSCSLPLGTLTVVTGVSGSGKSTLAFNTLYAEGQRRYVMSLSTYARQFLERLPRPEVDFISNLPPAISIEQRNNVRNARSTVGTASEISDHLRLLFAKLGQTRCPDCDLPARPGGVAQVAERVLERFEGRRILLAAPLLAQPKETMRERRDRLLREGHTRLLGADREVLQLEDLTLAALKGHWKDGLLLLDRLAPKREEDRARVGEAVAAAFRLGGGELVVLEKDGGRFEYREGFACDGCGRVFVTPTPALFSFNSPLGACETCSGFGRTAELDRDRVIPDGSATLEEGAVAPFATPMGRKMQSDLLAACEREGIAINRPYRSLSKRKQDFVFEGDEAEGGDWYGVRGYFDWLEDRRYRVQARVQISRYRKFERCRDCGGTRLRPESSWVWLAGRNIAELGASSIAELHEWVRDLKLDDGQTARGGRLLELLRKRLATSVEVGLGYITLDRNLRTLSGGEAQRIQLATALGGSLTSVLYVLDEPSIGLHPCDLGRLLGVLEAIRDQGNTVVVVEHALELVAAADHIIDMGPAAGRSGGEIVVAGSVDEVTRHPTSLTGAALRGEFEIDRAARSQGGRASGASSRRSKPGSLQIRGARANNLANIDVEIPLGRLVSITGVSGAGKSTLVHSVLVANLAAQLPAAEGGTLPPPANERGECDSIEGGESLRRVVVVEQTPASRSPRSNPATVSKAFEGVRKIFAGTREAKAAGWGPGWFSFNVKGGRCDACEGAGQVVIDMQFMDDIRVPCQECDGVRYRSEVLGIEYRGHSIAQVLGLSIDEALELFHDHAKIMKCLQPLARVGLGYLTLGQPLSTLSGGEHQRMRLGLALADDVADTLYVLDEPTTGLHASDIHTLLGCLDELIEAGGSVIVVEHNLDVIRASDHLIDIGPEGGPGGGRIVAIGSPAEVAAAPGSRTGECLAALLNPAGD